MVFWITLNPTSSSDERERKPVRIKIIAPLFIEGVLFLVQSKFLRVSQQFGNREL